MHRPRPSWASALASFRGRALPPTPPAGGAARPQTPCTICLHHRNARCHAHEHELAHGDQEHFGEPTGDSPIAAVATTYIRCIDRDQYDHLDLVHRQIMSVLRGHDNEVRSRGDALLAGFQGAAADWAGAFRSAPERQKLDNRRIRCYNGAHIIEAASITLPGRAEPTAG